MNRKPTMNDVARLAGVGRGTVSNYINGRKIKEANKQKIDKAIKELGYIPNLQARELKTSTN
ncbi:MAG: LacI family DNA-binding transcriptional regulator, partial [Lactobacillus amylovorus]